ncbi:MAG: hypothetical protein OEZ08_17000 [Betaproteobacteria bacterium]|nr:hypothetical protein [Betaproteobacteria bacterium]
MRALATVGALAIVPLMLCASAGAQDAAPVARILAERCAMCHQGEAAPLGLRLESIDSLLKGGSKGPVVKPGDPAGSELVRRLRGTSQPRMPLTGPPFLSDAEIASVERWIAAGAPRGAAAALERPPSRKPGEPLTYADVQPILGARCAKCHTDNGQMGAPPEGLRLNNHANTLASGDRARVVPGRPAASELVRRIRGQSLPRMPFDGPPYLSDEEIALVMRWIEQGARDADGDRAPVPVGARVRLGGMLVGPRQLDELDFEWQGRRREQRAAIGSRVELRGTVGADGRIYAERVRAR